MRTRTSAPSGHVVRAELALDRDGGVDRRAGRLEHGEELVGVRLDLVAAGAGDARPQDAPQLVDQRRR